MVTIIIVTHDSQPVLSKCLHCLEQQTVPGNQVVIVDSGSADLGYLEKIRKTNRCHIAFIENAGFAKANNHALALLEEPDEYILFINPDTFLESDTIKKSLEVMKAHDDIAILGARLKGYDITTERVTGKLDSTGIFRKWYGRWYDRGQGQMDAENYKVSVEPPAICGAFMFCRYAALQPLLPQLFDESFFMYKEDIDLCLRLRAGGWRLLYAPAVGAFHARGWQRDRTRISRKTRLLAARNEIRLTVKHRSPYLTWAFAKYLAVFCLDL